MSVVLKEWPVRMKGCYSGRVNSDEAKKVFSINSAAWSEALGKAIIMGLGVLFIGDQKVWGNKPSSKEGFPPLVSK